MRIAILIGMAVLVVAAQIVLSSAMDLNTLEASVVGAWMGLTTGFAVSGAA